MILFSIPKATAIAKNGFININLDFPCPEGYALSRFCLCISPTLYRAKDTLLNRERIYKIFPGSQAPRFLHLDDSASITSSDGMITIRFYEEPSSYVIQSLKDSGWWYNFKSDEWRIEDTPYNRLKISIIKTTAITVEDVVVITSMKKCIRQDHPLQACNALISIRNGLRIKEVRSKVLYCPECRIYYMLDAEYQMLIKQGDPCCLIYTQEEYIKWKAKSDFSTSRPVACGYHTDRSSKKERAAGCAYIYR